jgi:hypothetical protein
MSYVHVYGFVRSGTNFVRAQVGRSFYAGDPGTERHDPIMTGHWSQRYRSPAPPAWHLQTRRPHARYTGQRGIYVVRDGRDVAVSLWRSKTFHHRSWGDINFSDFLRRKLDWRDTPGQRDAPEETVIEKWLVHTRSWADARDVLFVRYEELRRVPEVGLDEIGGFIGRDPVTYDLVATPAAPDSHDYGLGAWRERFTDEDLAYFFNIVPYNTWGLWQ